MENFILKGAIIGFSIAAPIGPIGVLCIRRSLAEGLLAGFIAGLGAASADTIYSVVAATGVSAVSDFLTLYQDLLSIFGGLFLIYIGLMISKAVPTTESKISATSNLAAFFATLILTLTSPMTIFTFAVIYVGFGLASSATTFLACAQLSFGVFCGSALWWFILSSVTSRFRTSVSANTLSLINKSSALVICAFGVVAIARTLIS